MNIQDKRDQAFRVIQGSSVLYKEWCECATQLDRIAMLDRELWDMAFQEGFEAGYKQCDEDVSMGG